MPIISKFYGITIRMYFNQSEHNPPHLHAMYGQFEGVIDINTGNMINGNLPSKAKALIKEWVLLNKDELLQMWNNQSFNKIPPLN